MLLLAQGKKLGIRLLSPNHVTLYKEGSGDRASKSAKNFLLFKYSFFLMSVCLVVVELRFLEILKSYFSQLLIFCCCCFHGEGHGAS